MNIYTFHIDLYSLALQGTIFTGLCIALQLWFTKKRHRSANRFLALALTTVVLWVIWLLGIHAGLTNYFPRWKWLPLQYLPVLGPLIYFYVLRMIWPEYKMRPGDLLHFSPLFLQLSLTIIEVSESTRSERAAYDTGMFQQLNLPLQLLIFISISSYLYLSNKLVERFYQQQRFNEVSDRYRYELKWLQHLLAGFGASWFLWMLYTLANHFSGHGIPNYPVFLLPAIMITWIAASALARPDAEVSARAPSFKPLLPAQLKQKGVWLKEVMEAKLYHQDKDLTLRSLAETLGIRPNDLSYIINQVLKKGFHDFINEYRVADVIQKMQEPTYDKLTLVGIAMEAGFNSKSSFNRIFRDMTGKSPVEYKNWLKERPTYTLRPFSRPIAIISGHETAPRWSSEKLNRNIMFKNYLKIAYRNLVKNKAHSLINITGLSVGMAVAMLIGLWIWDELSFDKNFKNYDHLAQIKQNVLINGDMATGTSVPWPIGSQISKDYGSNFKAVSMASFTYGHILTLGDKKLNISGTFFEPQALDMLSVNMLKGGKTALNDPSSVLLSASTAKSYFGDADPMNKIMKIDNNMTVKVTGVYQDFPYASTFSDVNFIATWELLQTVQGMKQQKDTWRCNCYMAFAQTAENVDMSKASAVIKDVKLSKVDKSELKGKPQVFLDPMKNWHLYSDFKNGKIVGGRIQYVWLFGIIGVFVLLLACINFMNLSTAKSEKRAKEVGIRKAIGSLRVQLIYQFFSESLLVTILAFILAIVFVLLALPFFNDVAGKKMLVPWNNPLFWLMGIGFSLVTGIVSGSYPALYLSSFKPVKVLKGTFKVGRLAAIPRKALVVTQFVVSVTLIIGTIVVYRQIQFAKNRPVGYTRDGVMMLPMVGGDIHNQFAAVKDELFKSGAIANIAEAGSPTTAVYSTNAGFDWKGKDPTLSVDFPNIEVTPDYGKTVSWQFADGRDFSSQFLTDSVAFIINETAAKFMGLKQPVGETIRWDGVPFKVIGVIKDMVVESPYEPVRPMLYHILKGSGDYVMLKINPKISTSQAIEKIAPVFKKFNPSQPFDFQFADTEYAKKFGNEERIGKLASFFAALAIFISCLGLFGMASFMAEQRVKEIGVRKVLGATVFNLWRLLSTDFVILVGIALIIATPVSYYFMHGWLQKYTYRSDITAWIFVLTAAGAFIITLLTVSYQSIKAALMNPVKSLRSE